MLCACVFVGRPSPRRPRGNLPLLSLALNETQPVPGGLSLSSNFRPSVSEIRSTKYVLAMPCLFAGTSFSLCSVFRAGESLAHYTFCMLLGELCTCRKARFDERKDDGEEAEEEEEEALASSPRPIPSLHGIKHFFSSSGSARGNIKILSFHWERQRSCNTVQDKHKGRHADICSASNGQESAALQ